MSFVWMLDKNFVFQLVNYTIQIKPTIQNFLSLSYYLSSRVNIKEYEVLIHFCEGKINTFVDTQS